jgi:hypothetical protein
LQLLRERWQVFRDGFPHLVEIDVEVQMHQPISHGNDLRPGNLWISLLGFLPNSRRRLANYFNSFGQTQCPH